MFKVEDIKGCIQEWFGDCSNPCEAARTYAEIKTESENQLEYRMDSFYGKEKHTRKELEEE